MEFENFERGDTVVFRQDMREDALRFTSGLEAEGVEKEYEVVSVEGLNLACNCGVPDGYPHYDHCNTNVISRVGHHQWVTIQLPGGDTVYSGKFFKKVKAAEMVGGGSK